MLGAGGAARAVVLALAGAGARVGAGRRTGPPHDAERAAALAGASARWGHPADVAGADLVVNATPVGMGDVGRDGDDAARAIRRLLRPGQVVAELVYHPAATPLMAAATAAGARTANGVSMLVHQAAVAFTHWTGRARAGRGDGRSSTCRARRSAERTGSAARPSCAPWVVRPTELLNPRRLRADGGLTRVPGIEHSRRTPVALQGTIDAFPLTDVLQLLSSSSKSGRLLLEGDRGRAELWIDEGSVVGGDAPLHRPGAAQLVFELLRFDDGSFVFDAARRERPRSRSTPAELGECVRAAAELLEEWVRIEAVVPSMRHRVEIAPELAEEAVTVDRCRVAPDRRSR